MVPRQTFFLIFCVFVDRLNKNLSFFFLSRSYTISSICIYIYILEVGNTPYGKRHASRTISVTPLQSIFEESLHSRQSFWYNWQINSTHSSTRKTPQRRTLPITLRQIEKRTSYHATDRSCLTLNFGDNANQSHSDRCQPLTDRKARATQRSTRVRGCRMTKYRHSFTGCKHSKAYFFVIYS